MLPVLWSLISDDYTSGNIPLQIAIVLPLYAVMPRMLAEAWAEVNALVESQSGTTLQSIENERVKQIEKISLRIVCGVCGVLLVTAPIAIGSWVTGQPGYVFVLGPLVIQIVLPCGALVVDLIFGGVCRSPGC